jgi:predicted ATPase
MSKDLIVSLISEISSSCDNDFWFYEPFIRYIRFPFYKILKKNTKINFDFPLVVLVGENGTNKTSILHALFGCPKNKNLGTYWFETKVDIINNKNRNCFIYGCKHPKSGEIIEFLKSRVNKKANPDYWEPSRPLITHGMDRFNPEIAYKLGNINKTRWDLPNKNVVFIDFKESMFAYDLLFYHYNLSKNLPNGVKTKQDFIRNRSVLLSNVIKNNLKSLIDGEKECVVKNITLSGEICNIISDIMEINYSNIQIIDHCFYTNYNATTIFINDASHGYSEAFAGSGEGRMIILINQIFNAPNKSLILIDEPEISLHPRAQERFKLFLLRQILEKKHQVVITTHSPDMIKHLPPVAIKTLHIEPDNGQNKKSVVVKSDVFFSEAFNVIGHSLEDKIYIITEDILSKYIVDFYINVFRPNLVEKIIVEMVGGGADRIIIDNIRLSSNMDTNVNVFLLDGDKNNYPFYIKSTLNFSNSINQSIINSFIDNSSEKIVSKKISEQYNHDLHKVIKLITGIDIKFYPDSHKGEDKDDNLFTLMRKYIVYWEKNVFFIPDKRTPECFIINALKNNDILMPDINNNKNKELVQLYTQLNNDDFENSNHKAKQWFEKVAKAQLATSVNSQDIFGVQKMMLAKIKSYENEFSFLANLFESILKG